MLSNIPILSLVAYIPLVGALAIVFLVPREKAGTIKAVATGGGPARLPRLAAALVRLRPRQGGLPVRRARLLDSLARRRVPLRHRRHLARPAPADDAHGRHRRRLLVLGDHGAAEGVLRPAPAPADVHDRDLLLPRLLPLLRLLGSDARADVLPDRRLGRGAAALRGDQVLPVHAGRLGPDAARHHRALLPEHVGVPRLQGRRACGDVLDREADGRRGGACRWSSRSGSSSRSSSDSRSRCRCSRSTRGCPTRIPRRRRPGPSSWRRFC